MDLEASNMINGIKIHDICRTERYYTATLLPYVLLHEDFTGLRVFFRMLEDKGIDALRVETNAPVPLNAGNGPAHIELISEMDIARDTQFYSPWLPGLEDISVEESDRLRPDLVVVADRLLVVIEAKFFLASTSINILRGQILAQRKVIEKILLRFPGYTFDRYCHLFLSAASAATAEDLGCQGVLHWADIRQLAEQVLGEDHYVTERLARAIGMYELVNGKGAQTGGESGPNYCGRLGLSEMILKCQEEGDSIMVGYCGGAAKLKAATAEELTDRRFKWDRIDHSVGTKVSGNWLSGKMFLELVAGKGTPAPAGSTGPAQTREGRSEPNYRGRLGITEMAQKCQKEGDKILVGYYGGTAQLEAATAESLKDRLFKWDRADDPLPPKMPSNWMTGSRFLKLISGKFNN
jgi:hypothetical protein